MDFDLKALNSGMDEDPFRLARAIDNLQYSFLAGEIDSPTYMALNVQIFSRMMLAIYPYFLLHERGIG